MNPPIVDVDLDTKYNQLVYDRLSRRISQSLDRVYGPTGATGVTGVTGAPGTQGIQGPTGPAGPIGTQGVEGSVGPVGAAGEQGVQGVEGVGGPVGPIGAQGIPGSVGPEGTIGLPGAQGLPGIDGPQGPPGAQGPPPSAPRTTITKLLSHVVATPTSAADGVGAQAVPNWSSTYTASGGNVDIRVYITGKQTSINDVRNNPFQYFLLRNGLAVGFSPDFYNPVDYTGYTHVLPPLFTVLPAETGTNTYSISIANFSVDSEHECTMTIMEFF